MSEVAEASGISLLTLLGRILNSCNPSGKRFPFQEILALTVTVLPAGRQGLSDVARWGRQCSSGQLQKPGYPAQESVSCHLSQCFQDVEK
jgi:hypothetical protein